MILEVKLTLAGREGGLSEAGYRLRELTTSTVERWRGCFGLECKSEERVCVSIGVRCVGMSKAEREV